MRIDSFTVKTGGDGCPVLFRPAKARLKKLLPAAHKIVVVSNPTVFALHGPAFIRDYMPGGFEIIPVVMGDGERYKTQKTVDTLHNQFFDIGLSRQDAVVALGGGVVGDTAGMAAATFKRGVKFLQAPTSLLAMVDSSIGGKVGINHRLGKNLIGTFYQPSAILINPAWLATLGRREIVQGIGEMLKIGFISDKIYALRISLIKADEYPLHVNEMIGLAYASMWFKAKVVEKDVGDSGLRMILNFGHTFGHAIEKVEGFGKYRHGEAVLAGMAGALRLSHTAGKLSARAMNEAMEILTPYRKYLKPLKSSARDYLLAMSVDKKINNGHLIFVLLDGIGIPRIKTITAQNKILDAIDFMKAFVNG